MKKYVPPIECPDWCKEAQVSFVGKMGVTHEVRTAKPHGKRALLEKTFEVLGDVGAEYHRDDTAVKNRVTCIGKKLQLTDCRPYRGGDGVTWLCLTNLDDDEPGELEKCIEEARKYLKQIQQIVEADND